MKHNTGYFKGLEQLDLYYQSWCPESDPRAVLLIVHGLAEHSGRYKNLVDDLVPRGYALYALDHRGHGHSDGQRAYVERFTHYLQDLDTFFEMVRGWHPTSKTFMLGHSMGGTISLAYTLHHQAKLDGLILSAPGLQAGDSISPLTVMACKLLATLVPKMGVQALDKEAISRDPEVVARYDSDPLVYRGKICARIGAEMLKTMQNFADQAPQLHLPVLIMHGSADQIVNPQGSHWLYEAAGSKDKTLHVYEGYYHEIFNEFGREQVLADLADWLSNHL